MTHQSSTGRSLAALPDRPRPSVRSRRVLAAANTRIMRQPGVAGRLFPLLVVLGRWRGHNSESLLDEVER